MSMATKTDTPSRWRTLAETDPEIAAAICARSASAEQRARADRVGELRQPGRARSGRLGADQQVRRRAIRASATTAAASSSTSSSAAPSSARRQLFGAEHANVQPHSGAQANMAVYFDAAQAGRHGARHEPRARRPPHARPSAELLRASSTRSSRTASARTTSGSTTTSSSGSPHEHKPKMIIVGASAYPRVIDFARIARGRRRDRRAGRDRHGAHRRPGRGRRASEPGAALRLRHDDDAQDAARTARRHGAVPRAVREGSRPRASSPASRADR